MKLLLTGGHLAPAVAVIDQIINSSLKNKVKIVFVGRKYQFDTEKTLSLEYKEIKKKRVKFIALNTGRLTRYLSIKTFYSLIKIPVGFYQAWRILNDEKPNKILTFGGYMGFPIAVIGYLFQIPVFTHEQTIEPGLTNRILSIFSQKIFLAFEQTKRYFNSTKVIVTGNPIRQSVFKIMRKPFFINKDRPVVYITGGSVGSHSINIHIKKILSSLLKKFIIIHQTGDTKEYNDYQKLTRQRSLLAEEYKKRYFIKKHFTEKEIGFVYNFCDIVVARAGANTFFELISLEKPAIFIPLPWAANQEQEKHAVIFKENEVGEIFNQYDQSTELLSKIENMINKINFYKNNFNKLKSIYKKNASVTILKSLFTN